MQHLSIDIETYSSVNLQKAVVYKYAESPDFDILLFGYSVDGGAVRVIDIACSEKIPAEIVDALSDESVIKWAFNAQFERVCLSNYLDTWLSPDSWHCTMVWSATLGLPLSLEGVGTVLGLEKQKLTEGKNLIKYFCVPCAPTKTNGGRTRNLPHHDMEKWEQFKAYNLRDVETEMSIQKKLSRFPVPDFIWDEYHLDQGINDRGIGLDMTLVEQAISIDSISRKNLTQQIQNLTDLDNPNSVVQMKGWLSDNGLEMDTLGRKAVVETLKTAPKHLADVLSLRQQLAKSSVKKYTAMQTAVCKDSRARGMFQYYGANRTGRFAGRIIQLQNLPQNHMSDLADVRALVRSGNYDACLALNVCLIEYEEKGSKRIGTYDEFKGFFGKIYDVMKPGIADDYTVEDFGEVQLRYNDKFYRVIIGTGHNNVYACLNFLPTLARNISREEELCLALEYVSGTIDYFIEENKNDGVVEKRFVLPTEILFYKVQKFFKEEVKKYDILELDSLMMSEGTTIEKSHFVCREDNIYPLYNVSLLIDLYDIWENKIDFKEQISVANEGIIDRIYSLFEMDRSRSCSIFAPAMIFPEQKYDSSQRTYTFIAKASRGVVVALNADEYEEGQLEKEIANIEKYHKSGTLHIAETFNRFDKSGLRGIHIPADMPIEYLIYDSFMNPNQMHMSLGEEGKKRKTCTALDVIYYLNFMDDIDELFEYLSYSNEKDYESSFGFGSDAALYFTWKNQGRYIAKGAIIFNMFDVGYDTENEAVVDYFKEELKDYPFHMRDYLFREPFSWKIEKRDFDTYEYTVKHGMGFGGIYLPLPQKNYVFLTNNVEFYKDVKDFGEYRQWIQLLEEIITEGFDSIKCIFEDNKAISNTGIQIAFMPIEYAVHAGHESFLYEDRIYVYSDAQYYSHKWIIRYVVKDINRIYEDIQEAKNRSTEFNILREILIPLLDRMPDLNELFESKRKKVSLEKRKWEFFRHL